MGKTSVDTRKKLTRLISSCVGKAASAITHCNILDAEEGYKEAQRILKERFGNDLLIREAWLKRIAEGKIIKDKDKDALQALTDDVRNCTYTLKAMGQDISNLYEKVILVVARLPQYLRNRWRPKFVEYMKKEGKYPTLENLLEFLEGATHEMTDPMLQLLDKVTQDKSTSRPSVAFAAQSEVGEGTDEVNLCVLCNKNHWLHKCKLFLDMKPNERLDYATIKGLCYNCLRSSEHIASTCWKATGCDVEDCHYFHSRLLHEAFKDFEETGKKKSNSSVDGKTGSAIRSKSYACSYGKDPTSKICLPVVKMKIRNTITGKLELISALLDPGSQHCYYSESLACKIGKKGRKIKLNLSTLNLEGEADVEEHFDIDLVTICGKGQTCKVRSLYALKEFPDFRHCMAVTKELQNWQHLKNLDYKITYAD